MILRQLRDGQREVLDGGWRWKVEWNSPVSDGVDNDDVVAIAGAVVFYVACHKSENIMKLVRSGRNNETAT